jgi:pyruvate dehydrogenase kinase 2/3/4
MSKGILELKQENKISDIEAPQIQTFLNRFYTNRTEIRILLEQYLSLFDIKNNKNYFGIVNLNTNPHMIINDIIIHLQNICTEDLSDIIKINSNKKIELPSLNHYLYYILFEIIKNSIQAIRDKQKIVNNYIPCINITLNEIDNHWILIKIEDNGIGIKNNDMNKIWYYSFSTSQINSNEIIETTDFNLNSPFSGFGYGLPISDIYINFFNPCNNNIKIESVYKEGTTIYLYLRNYKSLFL